MTTVVITTTGSGSWTVPAGVTSITAECWGGGGAGPYGTTGGGGGWSSDTLAVTAGQVLNYYIASPQAYASSGAQTVGQDTWFGSTTTVLAKGANGYLGGQASAGRGSQRHTGGSSQGFHPDLGDIGDVTNNYGGAGASASKNGDGGHGRYNVVTGVGTGGVSPGGGGAGQSNVEGGGGASSAGQGGSPGGGSIAATSTRGQIRLTYEVAAPADTTAPTITSAGSAGVAENATLALALTANETVTWSLAGGADQARFEISGSTLRWAGNGTKDFEAPDDADQNNVYLVTVRATDAAGNTADRAVTITVTNVSDTDTTAPTIATPAGHSVAENAAFSLALMADEAVTWTKVGGADQALFTLSGATLSMPARDFEAPADADGNNVYQVTIRATDAAGNTADRTIQVTVTDVDDTAPPVTGTGTGKWDEAAKSYEFVLSNSDLTATHNRGYNASGSIYATEGVTTGDHTFKVTIHNPIGGLAIGVANKSRSLGATLGWSANDVAVNTAGNILFGNAVQGNIGTLTSGAVIEVRIKDRRFYCRKAGGLWNGSASVSPDAGNGVDIASIPNQPLFPLIFGNAAGLSFTGDFTGWNASMAPAPTRRLPRSFYWL